MSESTDGGIIQVRDVDPATLAVLRERARSLGQSLSGYLRDLMDADAATETNAEVIARIAEEKDVAVGIIDVKSYYIETPEDVADRVRLCLEHAPPERLSFAPDCGLSQTARWAANAKLKNMVAGVKRVREELGV